MKRFLIPFLFATVALAQHTPNINLNLPPFGTPNWDRLMNQNFTTLDNYLGGITQFPHNLKVPGLAAPGGSPTSCFHTDGSTGACGGVGVSQIIAGTNVTISPPGGTGAVTINATGGSGSWSSLTNPTGNLSLSMGANQTAFTHTNPFTAQSSFRSAFSMAGSGLDFGTEWNTVYSAFMPNAYPSDEFDVGIAVPNTSTAFTSNAFAAFVSCAQPSGLHYCVGIYGQARIAATGAEASAINGNATDNNISGILVPGEFNSQVANAGTTGATLIVTANVSHPGTVYDGIDIGGYGSTGHYRFGLSSVDPLTAPALIPNIVYSVAGTVLPTCSSGSYNGTELPVSDLTTTTAGAIYAGSGTVSGMVACGHNTSGLYHWYVVGAATFAGASYQVLDTFAGTVGTQLTAHTTDTGQSWVGWAQHSPECVVWTTVTLSGSGSVSNSSALCDASLYVNMTPSSANYTVCATGNTAGAVNLNISGRQSLVADTRYVINVNLSSGITLYKAVAGAYTSLGNAAFSSGASHAHCLVMSGTSISATLDGITVVGPVTDAAISAVGVPGLTLGTVGGPVVTNFTVQ